MPLEPRSTGDPHVAAHNEERDAINALEASVAGRIQLPNNPQTGQILRYNGSQWVGSAIRHFEGVGDPNNKVAAPLGSRYYDSAGTRGAVEWVKTDGADGNTGWAVLNGDTGWRDIRAQIKTLTNGVANHARIRRVGNLVDFYLDLKIPSNPTGSYNILDLPNGWHPGYQRYGILQDNNEAAAQSSAAGADGKLFLYGAVAGKVDRWWGTWLVPNPWPTATFGSDL